MCAALRGNMPLLWRTGVPQRAGGIVSHLHAKLLRRRAMIAILHIHRHFFMGSTTFGYHRSEDRIWLSHSGWKERIWLTRRMTQMILRQLGLLLEKQQQDTAPDAGRAAREHEAAINQPASGNKPLQVGQERVAQAEIASYLLCTGLITLEMGPHIDLQLQTGAGVRTIRFDREGLHRWLHAFLLVLKQADWNLPDVPEWLSRSYLPAALRAIWEGPLPENLDDEDEGPDNLPPAAPPPAKG